MSTKSSPLLHSTINTFLKDFRIELRDRHAINVIVMFSVTTLTVVSFSLGQIELSPKVQSALFWIILFFSSMAGLGQVFIREEEQGTALALRLYAEPLAVYFGKLLINLTLLCLVSSFVAPLFFIFVGAGVDSLGAFVVVVILGICALCIASTLIAAIIARATVRGALFSVLALPLLVVPLWSLVGACAKLFDGAGLSLILGECRVLTAYCVVMLTASIMLFKFVWQE